MASHDLQEPLRKIQAFGDRIMMKYQANLDEAGRDYLERMQNAARRMSTLITDLLAYSPVTTWAQPFTLVNLEEVAHDAVSNLEISINNSNGWVDIGPTPTVEADRSQRLQLLQNLIGNTLKFHRKDEPPAVRVYAEIVDSKKALHDNRTCRIFVQDNGIGFDEKYLDRILMPFQRLRPQSRYGGT